MKGSQYLKYKYRNLKMFIWMAKNAVNELSERLVQVEVERSRMLIWKKVGLHRVQWLTLLVKIYMSVLKCRYLLYIEQNLA